MSYDISQCSRNLKMGSSRIYLKSRSARNSTLNVDLLKYTPETVEIRLLSILRVNLY